MLYLQYNSLYNSVPYLILMSAVHRIDLQVIYDVSQCNIYSLTKVQVTTNNRGTLHLNGGDYIKLKSRDIKNKSIVC